MDAVFLQVVDMTASASILVGVVILLRLVLRKAPKAIHCALWAMVALRLVCPSLPESPVSLMPDSHPVTSVVQQETEKAPGTDQQPQVQLPQASAPNDVATTPAEPEKTVDWAGILTGIWLAGVGVMALYGIGSYLYLRRKVVPAVKEDGVWLCDHVASPFILGLLRPRIYLPSGLEEDYRASVLAHEQAHIRRGDHWWKPLGFGLLAVHWFNPVMWLAYVLLCRDIEAACDEKVVKGMDAADRRMYSEALLRCAAPRRSIAACPLAFGEQGIKGRIKSVLSYKKPTVWIIVAAIAVSAAVGIFFLTNPVSDDEDAKDIRSLQTLMEIVPEYVGMNGAEIYVWEEDGQLLCGALPVTSRYKTDEEIQALTGIKLEEMALLLDTCTAPDWNVVVNLVGQSQYWTPEQARDYSAIRELFYPRLGLYVRGMNEIVDVFTVATGEDTKQVFGDGYFYAKGHNGLYKVYCDDMEGIAEGNKLSISYVDKKEISSKAKYQITAKKVFNFNAAKRYENKMITMRIMNSDDCLNAFEQDCFYAIDNESRFYRVYCNDMTGLREGQLIRVTYRSDTLHQLEYPGGMPDGGYTPKYEMTAGKIEDFSQGEWTEMMRIVTSRPSALAFGTDYFYAYDSIGHLCRVYCGDMDGLTEGQLVRVTYREESRIKVDKINPPGEWTVDYELTAAAVYPIPEEGQYVATVYFRLYDELVYETMIDGRDWPETFWSVPITQEELEVLQGLQGDRQWMNPMLFSSLGWYDGSMNVVAGGKWSVWTLYRGGILTEKGFSPFTDEERAVYQALMARAALSEDAKNYFSDDYLVNKMNSAKS